MKIEGYYKCNCGAITIITSEKEVSCSMKNLKKFFENLDLRKITKYPKVYACNHCVNHYGLDLCSCGSGEEPDKCTNDFDMCGTPYQNL